MQLDCCFQTWSTRYSTLLAQSTAKALVPGGLSGIPPCSFLSRPRCCCNCCLGRLATRPSLWTPCGWPHCCATEDRTLITRWRLTTNARDKLTDLSLTTDHWSDAKHRHAAAAFVTIHHGRRFHTHFHSHTRTQINIKHAIGLRHHHHL